MGGILLRNLYEESLLANRHKFHTEVWIPPNDEQYIVASTSLTSAAADADFTLATPFIAHGQRLLWPLRPWIVLRNRNAAGNPPNITQVNDAFSGQDSFIAVVTGKFNGRTVVEAVTINLAALTNPAGQQRAHVITANYFDEITSIRHQQKNGTWGNVTALQVSVGIGNCELGDASNNRINLYWPFKVADPSKLKRLFYPEDNLSAAIGSAASNANIANATKSLVLPGRAAKFDQSQGNWTVQVGADTITKVAHGLLTGQTVRLKGVGDALPGNTAEGVTYYVVSPAADTIQIALTPGGAAIDLTAVAPFADGEVVEVLRPRSEWRRAVLAYDFGLKIEGQ